MQSNEDRLSRIEAALERSTNLLERVVQVQEQMISTQQRQDSRIQILVDAATRHEATITRLDAILERLIYKEGREDS